MQKSFVLAGVCHLFFGNLLALFSGDTHSKTLPTTPCVILHQWGPTRATPKAIAEKLCDIEGQLEGVDGVFLFLENSSFAVISAKPLDQQLLRQELKPLADLGPKQLKSNFALVYNDRPADLFDDWSMALDNWRSFAAECRRAGLVGIAFDNEEYFGRWADYPDDCKYKTKSLEEYREQARRRGREVMTAITAEFPEAVVITLHGPTLSAAGGPKIVYSRPEANELWGPFFVGLLEGCGPQTLLCDGGELYGLRTAEEFATAYRWQKRGIASADAKVSFIPEKLRRDWNRVSVAWGIYDSTDEETGRRMDPKTFRTTLANAVSHCDRFVWVYFEEQDMLNAKATAWHQAIASGKKDGLAMRQSARRQLVDR